ncbi:M20/M25/M40 family metallo-hydrolase [bacterium]|nr:M20/M25/M40 family metallo-hydrolase [bacterium]
MREASAVEAAFADIESQRERNNQWLIALNEIPAPPFREAERAADLVRRFETLGVSDVRIDEIGNVIAIRPGTVGQRTVAIVAHMDTVFPADTDVTVHRDGDVFTAPGIGDNTRGLVVMLALADALQKHDISTRDTLMFVGSVGEEGLGDLRGVRHLFGEGKRKIDSFIAIDGGQISRLVYAGVGSNRYRVTFKGPGGHSYGAFGRGHPHQALAAAIAGFTERATPITRSPGARATFSVGMIGGGTSINSIPFESWMEVDMRSTDPRRLDALDAAFKSSIDVALAEENARRTIGDALEVEVEPVGRRPAGQGERTGTLVRRAIAAIELLGGEPELEASSTDANIPIWLGVPAVTIGRGGISRNSHAPDESWEDKDSHLAIQLALLLVLLEAGEG